MISSMPLRQLLIVGLSAFVLAACAETQFIAHTAKRIAGPVTEKKKPAGIYKVGDPYQIENVWYYPAVNYTYDETGIASWYGSKFHGRSTANGETYDMNDLTAAHRTLPLPSIVLVTNLDNGRTLRLRVNDRGPYARGRIIDVSRRASQLLGFNRNGTARVRVRIMAQESRAEAARIKGETLIAGKDTPIIVSSLPKEPVISQALPAPPGAVVSAPVAPETTIELTSAEPAAPETAAVAARVTDGPELGKVTVVPVKPTNLFVQAGAFAYYDNANRTRAMLSPLGSAKAGSVKVSSVLVGGKDLFRVRLGPISDVAEADRMLEQIIRAGYSDARIIVD